jgi:putative transposase
LEVERLWAILSLMRAPYTKLYLHLVWSTWDRLPLITTEFEARLYSAILAKCKELRCEPVAVGGIEDHLHLLTRLSPSISISELVRELKGSTSRLMSISLSPGSFFKWQGGYGAFTLRPSEIPVVRAYIQNQREHHQKRTFFEDWETTEEPEF